MAEKKISLPVVNLAGEKVGDVKLSAEVFGITEKNEQAIHDAVVAQSANARQATAKTKKRHEVSGGGKKPYRQKGTGRARAGSSRSPIWVGGGTVFGPDGNQNYTVSQNKKAHNLALKSVLSEKVGKGLIVVDSYKLAKISTKEFASKLKALGCEGKKNLIVVDGDDEKLILSARGIKNAGLVETDNIAVYDVLYFDNVIVSKEGIKKIEEALQ